MKSECCNCKKEVEEIYARDFEWGPYLCWNCYKKIYKKQIKQDKKDAKNTVASWELEL